MKKILFIGPRFHNFETHIIKAIQKNNFEVDFFNEKIDIKNNILFRVIQKLPNFLFNIIMKKYFKKIILFSKNKEYDYIFIIRGEFMDENFMRELKKENKNSKFIMYQWDFFENLPNVKSVLKFFDKIYTFDAKDAKEYNLSLKPLFYTGLHKEASKNNKIKYDISFIGTHHSDRFEFIRLFKKINNLGNKKIYTHLYRPKLSYLYSKYIARLNIGDIKYNEVQSRKVLEKETIDILSKSNAILDIHHVKQNGLTIRTLEAIGMKKKLITTNFRIKDYDFYNSNNIFILDRKNPKLDMNFLENSYENLENEIYEKYSIDYWVKDIFNF